MGFEGGKVAGQKVEYDRFWDVYQQNGNRTDYRGAFNGTGWNIDSFKPKYDLRPVRTDYMFAHGSLAGCDLVNILDSLGIVLDTSQATGFNYFTLGDCTTHFPILDLRGDTWTTNLFISASVETIDKLIFKDDGSQIVSSTLSNCGYLKNVVFEGVIGNDMNISGSGMLTKTSITSIINALSNTTTGTTLQLSKRAVNTAFETSMGAADGSTSAEWLALVASKPNWTITLA